MPRVTDDDRDGRRRHAAAVKRIWDTILACTEDHGEYTAREWSRVLADVRARIVSMETRREGRERG